MSKIFVDFEMTGLTMKDKPISIGVVTEDGYKFYAEFEDYDIDSCSDWVKENVINNLKYNNSGTFVDYDGNNINMKSNTRHIAQHLYLWLEMYCTQQIEFIGDVCHYDFCHFLELFGGALSNHVIGFIHPVAYDINMNIGHMYNVNQYEAFDINREELLKDKFNIVFDNVQKYNALYDAMVIKEIYDQHIKKLELEVMEVAKEMFDDEDFDETYK